MATRLEAARRARKWTQEQLGKRARVSQPTISAAEHRLVQPWPGPAKRLAKALGLKAEELTQDAEQGRA